MDGGVGDIASSHKIHQKSESKKQRNSMASEILELRHSLRSEASARLSDVTRLDGELNSLQGEMEIMKANLNMIKAEKEYSKYVTALQDLNAFYSLEKEMSHYLSKKNVVKLRRGRNGESHCIMDDDYEELKCYKTVSVRDRLDTMSPACAAKFTTRFGTSFINAVKQFRNKRPVLEITKLLHKVLTLHCLCYLLCLFCCSETLTKDSKK